MKRQVLAIVCLFCFYAVFLTALSGVDAPVWTQVLATLAPGAMCWAYCAFVAPRRARARLLKAADPSAGPPPGAVPVDSPLINHLDMLLDSKDYDAFRAYLSRDFGYIVGRIQFGAGSYIRSLKSGDGERRTEAVLVHPDEPDVMWVRSTHTREPHSGAPYVFTTWTRITLTPDGSRVREIEGAGVLQVA